MSTGSEYIIPTSISRLFISLKKFWKYSFNFTSATCRSDYWLTLIANYFIAFVLYSLAYALPGIWQKLLVAISIIFSLLLIIPGIAIVCRRYVDIGHPYWNGIAWEGFRAILRIIYLSAISINLYLMQGSLQIVLPNGNISNTLIYIINNNCLILGIIIGVIIFIIDLINLKAMCSSSKTTKVSLL